MNMTIGMLAEALAKVLQTPQTTSSQGPCPRCKHLKPPVENFTDTQHQDNKVRNYLKQIPLLTQTSGKCPRVQKCIPYHKRQRIYASCASATWSYIVFRTWNGPWSWPTCNAMGYVDHTQLHVEPTCHWFTLFPVCNYASSKQMGYTIFSIYQRWYYTEIRSMPQVLEKGSTSQPQQQYSWDHATSGRSTHRSNKWAMVSYLFSEYGSILSYPLEVWDSKKVTATLLSDRIVTGKHDQAVWEYNCSGWRWSMWFWLCAEDFPKGKQTSHPVKDVLCCGWD